MARALFSTYVRASVAHLIDPTLELAAGLACRFIQLGMQGGESQVAGERRQDAASSAALDARLWAS